MTILQAYTDDSAAETGDQRLFLAGYIHTADGWAQFSDLWAGALATEPAIDYLHMVEANGLRGQFKAWSAQERDAKLRTLARVIQFIEPMSFEFSVSRRDHDRLVKPVSPRGIGSAHFTSIFAVVSAIARHVHEIGIDVPIDFIFDEQEGADDDIDLFFAHMKKSLPTGAQALINGNPLFRDDRAVSPLQAADMLAWHIRREHELGSEPAFGLPMADALRNPNGHLSSRIEESHLRRWGREFRKMPGIPFVQGKSQWKGVKREIRRLVALGIDPATIKISDSQARRIAKQIGKRGTGK